jgi:hypothetical protein
MEKAKKYPDLDLRYGINLKNFRLWAGSNQDLRSQGVSSGIDIIVESSCMPRR